MFYSLVKEYDRKKYDLHEKYVTPCYEDDASFFSWATVSYLRKLISKASRKMISIGHLGKPSKHLDPNALYASFEKEWKKEEHKSVSKQSFMFCIIRSIGILRIIFTYLLSILSISLQFVPTMLLDTLIQDLEENYLSTNERWLYSICLLIIPVCTSMLSSVSKLLISRLSVAAKMIASEAIYRKTLSLSSQARSETSAGQIVNIMGTDTYNCMMFMMNLNRLCVIPVTITISFILMYKKLNGIAYVVYGILGLMIVIQGFAIWFGKSINDAITTVTDTRVKMMNEILMGIRVIKYYCWDVPFRKKIDGARKEEMRLYKKLGWIMSLCVDAVITSIPHIASITCYTLYMKMVKKPLTSSLIFTTQSLIALVVNPFYVLPPTLMFLIQFQVSSKRIIRFLNLDQIDTIDRSLFDSHTLVHDANDAIIIEKGTFSWGYQHADLKDLCIRIKKGSLVGIVGGMGSGKSSLISSIVGEMKCLEGRSYISGPIAYTSQEPWLFNDTVRNNILFGREYDEERYQSVISACSLTYDIRNLAGGDQCQVSDRGINVSGGQKARISLARCCYNDSDIVVMDDPIAAVDNHTKQCIFHNCIRGLMKDKTRILVCSSSQFLPYCDEIIVMNNNCIVYDGNYAGYQEYSANIGVYLTDSLYHTSVSVTERKPENGTSDEYKNDVNEENKQFGSVSNTMYSYYFNSLGKFAFLVIVSSFLACIGVYIAENIVLTSLGDDKNCIEGVSTECMDSFNHHLRYYVLIILSDIAVCMIRQYYYVTGKTRASKHLHNQLTDAIMNAPVSFHDVTPVGRILNRFNKDMATIDNELPSSFVFTAEQLVFTISQLLSIVVISTSPYRMFIILIFVAFYSLQKRFKRAIVNVQRIESISRSPVFSSFQSVLYGTPTIRVYHHEKRFITSMEQNLELNGHATMTVQALNTWLSLRCDWIIACLSFSIASLCNLFASRINPGIFGLALSSCIEINEYLKDALRYSVQTDTQMNAVERVVEYIQTVPREVSSFSNATLPFDWPVKGEVKYVDAKLRFRDGPLVMKGINLDVQSREKLGIVGPTGAGKSTMMIGLFRIHELCEGSIYIDDVDIKTIHIDELRKSICIIPQDAILFSASIRFNLDPFQKYADHEIWNVLDQVGLKESVSCLPHQLDEVLKNGGDAFSAGEKQLYSIARALLRKPRIVVMDEATSSLDQATNMYLQEMIEREFKDCTVLSIAHQLSTIMKSDRVCVLENGLIAECNTPYALIHDPASAFLKMIKESGDIRILDYVNGCEDVKKELEESGYSIVCF